NEAVEASQDVSIKNNDKETDKTFDLDVTFLPENGPIQDAVENGVKMELPKSIDVAAGKTENINPTIHIPAEAAYGHYEGYIKVVNQQNDGESFQIPFSIRVTDKGIDYVEVSPPAIATDSVVPVFTLIRFKLKSEMETMDVIANDYETGEPVGFVGTLDVSNFSPDKVLGTRFNGKVFPFTDDPEA